MSTIDGMRLMQVMREQIDRTPLRTPTYRRSLLQALSTIVTLERQHALHHTNIQQRIDDQVNVLGKELNQDSPTFGGPSS